MPYSTAVALVVLAVIGACTIHGLSVRNGFYDMLTESKIQDVLPNDGIAPKFTGLEHTDEMLSKLVVFFWPVVNWASERAGLRLMGFLFTGQSCAALTILMIEGMRKGHEGRAVSLISLYSTMIQLTGFAFAVPIYLTIYVLTSPTFSTPTSSSLFVSNIDAIPFGLLFGFIIPSIYMILPTPSILSLKYKIWSVLLWQPSPIYAIYISKILSALSPHKKAKETSVSRQLMHLRAAYKFALLVSVPVHLISWVLSLCALFFPSLFTYQVASALQPLNALVPQNLFTAYNAKAVDIAQGSHWFLQWDYWIGSLSYLVFAIGAKYTALKENPLQDVFMILGRVVVLGPLSTALVLLWDRDEMVMGKEEKNKKKGT